MRFLFAYVLVGILTFHFCGKFAFSETLRSAADISAELQAVGKSDQEAYKAWEKRVLAAADYFLDYPSSGFERYKREVLAANSDYSTGSYLRRLQRDELNRLYLQAIVREASARSTYQPLVQQPKTTSPPKTEPPASTLSAPPRGKPELKKEPEKVIEKKYIDDVFPAPVKPKK